MWVFFFSTRVGNVKVFLHKMVFLSGWSHINTSRYLCRIRKIFYLTVSQLLRSIQHQQQFLVTLGILPSLFSRSKFKIIFLCAAKSSTNIFSSILNKFPRVIQPSQVSRTNEDELWNLRISHQCWVSWSFNVPRLFMKIIFFRYEGSLLDENVFSEALSEGFANEEIRNLIIWLANEISELGNMEEKVNPRD